MRNINLKKIVILLAMLTILVPACFMGLIYYKLNSIQDYQVGDEILSKKEYKEDNKITNILLCGTDERPGETSSRTDSMMILTLDSINKNLKLTSLARDTYVKTSEYGNIKLTEAHAYGGLTLLIETIERNFKIDIQNYVVVDFYSFMDLIETIGGITVNIKENEMQELNKFIPETYKFFISNNKEPIKYIEKSGEQKINGYQALAYCRIRKGASGGALERDRRQREVIESIISAIMHLPITEYPKLVDSVLPYVKTNIKPNKIISLGSQVLKMEDLNINQMEFPINDGINGQNVRINNKDVIGFEESSLDILHDFIFKNINYESNN